MAEEKVVVTGTTKTDPAEMSARQKWQASMASHLQEQTAGQSEFTDAMKNMVGGFKTDEALAQQTKMSGLLTTVQSNTFKTANLLEGYIDFMKDAERKRLEAAMEAARLKKDDKGKDQAGAIHRFDQVYRFWRTFNPKTFDKALGLLRTTWNDQPALSEPHWGLCWLFKQNPSIDKGDQNLMSRALRERWNKAGTLWREANRRIEKQYSEDSWQYNADNGLKIASAMYSAIKKYFDEVEIVCPKDSKKRTIDVDIPIME